MVKKIKAIIKLQIPAAQATPAPPVGPALAQHGLTLRNFAKSLMKQQKTSRVLLFQWRSLLMRIEPMNSN